MINARHNGVNMPTSASYGRMCFFFVLMAVVFFMSGKLEAAGALLFCSLCKFQCYGIMKEYEKLAGKDK